MRHNMILFNGSFFPGGGFMSTGGSDRRCGTDVPPHSSSTIKLNNGKRFMIYGRIISQDEGAHRIQVI